jgi:preprotein translocase subunit SecE
MNNIVLYLKESYYELLHKVSWPNFKELVASTRIVLTATLIFTLLVFLIDLVSKTFTSFFYNL